MRPTRLLLPACAALLLSAGTAAAQAAGAHGQHHPQQDAQHAQHQPEPAKDGWAGDLPAHFEGITLSAAQRARIVALQKEYHARMAAIRDSAKAAGAGADDATVQARVQAVMAEEHGAFKAVLDDAGRKRFDENMARMHAGKGHGAHGSGRPPRD